MKFWKILFFLAVTFGFFSEVRASVGDEVNALLERFFGSEEAFSPEKIPDSATQKFEIPADFSDSEIRAEILAEEEKLAKFEAKILETEREIRENGQSKNSAATELFLLDSATGILTEKRDRWKSQAKKWLEILEKITREKSVVRAEIRAENREFERFLTREFVRSSNLEGDRNYSILKWLFLPKTVSEILEEARKNRAFEARKRANLARLKSKKADLDARERVAAELRGRAAKLQLRAEEEQKTLANFAAAKADLIAKFENLVADRDRELENFRRQQAESTILLQNLRNALVERDSGDFLREKKSERKTKLDFPLKIPMKITAKFQDEKYKKAFGKSHNAVDFFAPQGTEIFAPANGIVKKTASNGYGYSYLILEHGEDFFTVLGHLSAISVNEGQEISRGDLIGKTGGERGRRGAGYFTSGPHLHFEVFHEGEFVDPMRFFE